MVHWVGGSTTHTAIGTPSPNAGAMILSIAIPAAAAIILPRRVSLGHDRVFHLRKGGRLTLLFVLGRCRNRGANARQNRPLPARKSSALLSLRRAPEVSNRLGAQDSRRAQKDVQRGVQRNSG